MKKIPALVTVLLGGLLVLTPVQAAGGGGSFLPPGAIDLPAVLPPPPAAGSVAALGDLETVRQVQAARTPADVAWAKLIEKDQVFNHASVLGSWFTRENLPVTAEFLRRVTEDMFAAGKGAKGIFPRPRPPRADPAVQPCVELSDSGSYPSGHAMQAHVWAAVLGDIFPDRQAALRARAQQAAWGRVVGGVHDPSDLVGGRLLAEAIVAALRKSPAYRAGLEKCRAEAAPFLLQRAA